MRLHNGYAMVLIAALGIAASGFFVTVSAPMSGPDAIQYDRVGYNLASGHGFSLSEHGPYVATMLREPAYPFFLAGMYAIFGHRPGPVFFAQMVMHAAVALLTYLIGRGIFSERAAFTAGCAVALFPTLANMPAYILSETMFTLILCLGVFVFLKGMKGNAIVSFALAGALFGLLALTKAVALFLPFFIAATSVVVALIKKRLTARYALGLALFLVICTLTLSVWCVRNKALFGTCSLTVRSGETLWSRAAKLDYPPKKIAAAACYNFSEFLGSRFFPEPAYRPERYLYQDLDKAEALWKGYRNSGLTEPQADGILKKEAMEKIAKRPIKYCAYTFIEAIKMTAFTYVPVLNEPGVTGYFDGIRNGRLLLAAVKGAMRLIAIPILILFLAGIVKNHALWDRWLVLFAVTVYFNVVCSLLDAIGRYGVPLIPFYFIIAVSALYAPDAAREKS